MDLILLTTEQILNLRRVYSTTDRRALGVPTLVQGTTPAFQLFLIDNTGAYTAASGSALKAVRAALATPGMSAPLVTLAPADFTRITNGWSFSLPLTADAIAALLADANKITTYLEISYADIVASVEDTTTREVIYRAPVTILPALYDPSAIYYAYADLVQAVVDAQAAKTAADADAVATAADRVQTGLDRTATGQDAVATAADRVQTGLDRTATGQDAVATAADRVQTGLDRTATGQDAVATAADRVQTGLDRTATGQAAVATAADRVQTGLDRTTTGQDAVATAADRVQTGLDRTATGQDAVATAADKAACDADAAAAAASAGSVLNFLASQFKGAIAGASVPATSSAAGDWYVISVGGTSQSKTWVADDRAYYKGTSGSWSQVTGQLNWESRILAGDTTRALAASLLFDGATSGVRAYVGLGSAGAIGTNDFNHIFKADFPASWPTSEKGLAWIGSSSTQAGGGVCIRLIMTATNAISIGLNDWSGGTYRIIGSTAMASYAGLKGVLIAWGRSGGVPFLYLNGVLITLSGEVVSGAAPAWSASLSATYLGYGVGATGQLYSGGNITPGALMLSALTAAEVLTWTQTGRLPDWCAFTGGAVAVVAPGTLNGGFETTGGGGGVSPFANTYGGTNLTCVDETSDVHSGSHALRLTGAGLMGSTGANNFKVGTAIANTLIPGTYENSKVTVTLWVKYVSGGNFTAGGMYGTKLTVTPAQAPNWTQFTYSYTIAYPVSSPAFGGDAGAVWLVDDVTVNVCGPIARHVIQPVACAYDYGTNKLPLVLTAGVTPITDKREWVIHCSTNTSGNQQLLGASAFFDYTKHIIDDWCMQTTGTPTVSAGSASAGAQYKASAAIAATKNMLTLVTRVPASANLWVASNDTSVIYHTIRGHMVD